MWSINCSLGYCWVIIIAILSNTIKYITIFLESQLQGIMICMTALRKCLQLKVYKYIYYIVPIILIMEQWLFCAYKYKHDMTIYAIGIILSHIIIIHVPVGQDWPKLNINVYFGLYYLLISYRNPWHLRSIICMYGSLVANLNFASEMTLM